MSTQQSVNLATILKRLEAVTSRLEDVASGSSDSRSDRATNGGTAAAVASPFVGGEPPSTESTPATKAYEDEIVNGAMADLFIKAKQAGPLVEQHTALLAEVCAAQLAFLQMASAHQKPGSPSALGPLLKPQADAIQAVVEAKDTLGRTKEGRDWGVCFSVVSEGVGAWGWVQVEPAPAPFIGEMKDAAQFWGNRVTKQFKDTNPAAVEWSKAFMSLVDTLQKYVKQWHTTGVTWNPKGSPAPSSMPSSAGGAPAPPPPPAGGPPPPPPPPPADFASSPAPSSSGPTGQAALLADLNRGGSVTSGLKKVDASQMTHKNPSLRGSSTVSSGDKKAPPAVKAKPGALSTAPAKKPARMELEDGNKWIVEWQEDNKDITIEQTELSHTVHIFNCKNSVVRVSGKINAVTMVGCKKTALVLDSAVSSLSITSSPSFEVQITGSIPTITIDTTDSGAIYLSQACMDAVEVITSKTSGINISVPTGPEGDFEEKPVPEQIKSKMVNGKLVTTIVEHAG